MRRELIWLVFLLICCLVGPVQADPPNWSVTAGDFVYSCNLTGVLYVNEELAGGSNFQLAAFVDDEIRGVASPIYTNNAWYYFLTVFADVNGETVHFQAYLPEVDQVTDVEETAVFGIYGAQGSISDPLVWNTYYNFDWPPVVQGIPGQIIEQGENFTVFDLDDFGGSVDNEPVQWSYSGNQDLQVWINNFNRVTILPPNAQWMGSETLIFTIRELTANSFTASDTADFAVVPPDEPPVVFDIPDIRIGFGSDFPPFDLDDYLLESDGDPIAWSYEIETSPQGHPLPGWSVNPGDYQFEMSLTIVVENRGQLAHGDNHRLAAFIGGEVRGISQVIPFDDLWLYYLTVYANTNSETVTFKFFDAATQETLPVADTLVFAANGQSGSPLDPVLLRAGYLLIHIDPENEVTLDIVDENWQGSETVVFTAKDTGTVFAYADSDPATFTVLLDRAPQIMDIPDQVVPFGAEFAPFDLDDYLVELDGDPVSWGVSGNSALEVTVDMTNWVMINRIDGQWSGSETLVFSAIDETMIGLSAQDTVTLTMQPADLPPQVWPMIDRIIEQNENFPPLNLNDYLINPDGNEVSWSYEFLPPIEPTPTPGWSINVANFQSSMNVTATVNCRAEIAQGAQYILAAFAGNECRGVSEVVDFNGTSLHYLTIYANTNGETIHFEFYDADAGLIVPAAETLLFSADANSGTPLNPFGIHAGFVFVTLNPQHLVYFEIVDNTWIGTESVRFTVTDQGTIDPFSAFADMSLTVVTFDPENNPPVARNDFYTLAEDSHIQIGEAEGLVKNDYDLENDPLTVGPVTEPIHGEVTMDTNGAFTYVPDPDFFGNDTFIYQASDGANTSNLATVTFTVNPIPDPPVARPDAYPAQEDLILNIPVDQGLLANDYDVDNDVLTTHIVDWPAHGQVDINPDGSFSYLSQNNYNGPDTFTYRNFDGLFYSAEVAVSLTIAPVNDRPIVQNDNYETDEDVTLTVDAGLGVLTNDYDLEDDPLTAAVLNNPAHGTLVLSPDGSLTYTPAVNYHGPDAFRYRANDGLEISSPGVVLLTINPVNDPPSPVADTFEVEEDQTLIVDSPGLLENDSDLEGNPFTALLAIEPGHGTVEIAPDGSFIYTPAADFCGEDVFSYLARDNQDDSEATPVNITVHPINDPPQIVDLHLIDIWYGHSNVIPLYDHVSDVDNDWDEITWAVEPGNHFSIEIDHQTGTGLLHINDFGWIGSELITLTATDPDGLSDGMPVQINLHVLSGDVSLDGSINLVDIDLIRDKILGHIIFTPAQNEAADANQDLTIDILDLVHLTPMIMRTAY